MRNNIVGQITAVLLAVAIVAGGMLAQRYTLAAQRQELITRRGYVQAKDLAPYANDHKRLVERISALSGNFEEGSYTIREPLDTELSYDAVLDAGNKVIAQLIESFAAYGVPIQLTIPDSSNGSSLYAEKGDEYAVSSSPDYDTDSYFPLLHGQLAAASDDPSISAWMLEYSNFSILLDALSGTPLYISFPVYLFNAEELDASSEDAMLETLWVATAQCLNTLYADTLDFPEFTGNLIYEEKSRSFLMSGHDRSGELLMEIRFSFTRPGYVTNYSIKISA